MMRKLMRDYASLQSKKCREHGCSVVMPDSLKSYCGEAVRQIAWQTSFKTNERVRLYNC